MRFPPCHAPLLRFAPTDRSEPTPAYCIFTAGDVQRPGAGPPRCPPLSLTYTYIGIRSARGPSSYDSRCVQRPWPRPHRRQVLDVLARGERPVNDLVTLLGFTQPQVSKHLRVLREGRTRRRGAVEGRQQRVPAQTATLSRDIHDWLKPYERSWSQRFRRARCRVGRTQGGWRMEKAMTSSGTASRDPPDGTRRS